MKLIGLVPARGGSKGVPRKNIKPLLGKPLIQYTLEAASESRLLTRTIVSTDDQEIAEVCVRLGADVPFLRPSALGADKTAMIDVVLHALDWLREQGDEYDAVCLLQPTNPLRTAGDIDGAIEVFQRAQPDSVISFVEVGDKHPGRMKYLGADNRIIDPPFAEEFEGQRRQDLPKVYLREGSIYLTKSDVLVTQRSFKGNDCRAWMMPEARACNIDSELDFLFAEFLLRRIVHEQSGVF